MCKCTRCKREVKRRDSSVFVIPDPLTYDFCPDCSKTVIETGVFFKYRRRNFMKLFFNLSNVFLFLAGCLIGGLVMRTNNHLYPVLQTLWGIVSLAIIGWGVTMIFWISPRINWKKLEK